MLGGVCTTHKRPDKRTRGDRLLPYSTETMATDGGMARDVEFLQQQGMQNLYSRFAWDRQNIKCIAVFPVQRLNAVLSQYQNKYQPPGPQDEQVYPSHSDTCELPSFSEYVQGVPLSSQGPHASWLTDRRYCPYIICHLSYILVHSYFTISTDFWLLYWQSMIMSSLNWSTTYQLIRYTPYTHPGIISYWLL